MARACCLTTPLPLRDCITGPPGAATSVAHWATRALQALGAAAIAHAGPGTSPRLRVAMFTTTTTQGRSSTATAAWRRQRNAGEASMTKRVGGL
eukprot:1847526-Alexandrium_andersonii.AAC.1